MTCPLEQLLSQLLIPPSKARLHASSSIVPYTLRMLPCVMMKRLRSLQNDLIAQEMEDG